MFLWAIMLMFDGELKNSKKKQQVINWLSARNSHLSFHFPWKYIIEILRK